MARKRKRGSGDNVSGYFRRILEERRDLLKGRSNDELYKMWLKDHPGVKEVPLNVKQGLSNVKSNMRHKKKGKQRAAAAMANGVAPKARVPAAVLERLEVDIDNCLSYARSFGEEALKDVARELRKARNAVVRSQGH